MKAPAMLKEAPQGRMGAGETCWKDQLVLMSRTTKGGPRFPPDPFSRCLGQRLIAGSKRTSLVGLSVPCSG